MSDGINWAEMLLGGVVGYTISQIPQFSRYIYNLTQKNRFIGVWNHYYLNSNSGNIKLHKDKFTIRKGYLNKLSYETEPVNYNGDNYIGYIFEEKNFLVAISNARNDDEMICHRFKINSYKEDNDMIISFTLAHDFDGNSSVNPSILTKSTLDINQFHSLLSENIRIFSKERVMTMKT